MPFPLALLTNLLETGPEAPVIFGTEFPLVLGICIRDEPGKFGVDFIITSSLLF